MNLSELFFRPKFQWKYSRYRSVFDRIKDQDFMCTKAQTTENHMTAATNALTAVQENVKTLGSLCRCL